MAKNQHKDARDPDQWIARLSSELSAFEQFPQQPRNRQPALLRTLRNLERKDDQQLSSSRENELTHHGELLSDLYWKISPEVFYLCSFSIPAAWLCLRPPKNLLQIIWTWWQTADRPARLTELANSMNPIVIEALSKFRHEEPIDSEKLRKDIEEEEKGLEKVHNKEPQKEAMPLGDDSVSHCIFYILFITKFTKAIPRTYTLSKSFFPMLRHIWKRSKRMKSYLSKSEMMDRYGLGFHQNCAKTFSSTLKVEQQLKNEVFLI